MNFFDVIDGFTIPRKSAIYMRLYNNNIYHTTFTLLYTYLYYISLNNIIAVL